jgi:hypothetical protein
MTSQTYGATDNGSALHVLDADGKALCRPSYVLTHTWTAAQVNAPYSPAAIYYVPCERCRKRQDATVPATVIGHYGVPRVFAADGMRPVARRAVPAVPAAVPTFYVIRSDRSSTVHASGARHGRTACGQSTGYSGRGYVSDEDVAAGPTCLRCRAYVTRTGAVDPAAAAATVRADANRVDLWTRNPMLAPAGWVPPVADAAVPDAAVVTFGPVMDNGHGDRGSREITVNGVTTCKGCSLPVPCLLSCSAAMDACAAGECDCDDDGDTSFDSDGPDASRVPVPDAYLPILARSRAAARTVPVPLVHSGYVAPSTPGTVWSALALDVL